MPIFHVATTTAAKLSTAHGQYGPGFFGIAPLSNAKNRTGSAHEKSFIQYPNVPPPYCRANSGTPGANSTPAAATAQNHERNNSRRHQTIYNPCATMANADVYCVYKLNAVTTAYPGHRRDNSSHHDAVTNNAWSAYIRISCEYQTCNGHNANNNALVTPATVEGAGSARRVVSFAHQVGRLGRFVTPVEPSWQPMRNTTVNTPHTTEKPRAANSSFGRK